METRLLLLLLLFVRTLKWAGQVPPPFPSHFDRYNEIPPSLPRSLPKPNYTAEGGREMMKMALAPNEEEGKLKSASFFLSSGQEKPDSLLEV